MKGLIFQIRDDVAGGSLLNALRKHPVTSIICSAAWWIPAKLPAPWRPCWIGWPPKEKTEQLKAKTKSHDLSAGDGGGYCVTAILLTKWCRFLPRPSAVLGLIGLYPVCSGAVGALQNSWMIVLVVIAASLYAFRGRFRSAKFAYAVDICSQLPVVGTNAIIPGLPAPWPPRFTPEFPLSMHWSQWLALRETPSTTMLFCGARRCDHRYQPQQAIKTSGMFLFCCNRWRPLVKSPGRWTKCWRKRHSLRGVVDNSVDNLTSLLEPLIMAVLGVLVGGLLIAMYLPIFQWVMWFKATLRVIRTNGEISAATGDPLSLGSRDDRKEDSVGMTLSFNHHIIDLY